MAGPGPYGWGYDITINNIGEWDKLTSQALNVIVDPLIYRIGQFFLEGRESGSGRWATIESDLGALVTFFDLIVLHDQLPAFNYPDTFDRPGMNLTLELRDRLGDVMNAGDKTLVHVDVEHYLYREAKKAAIDQLDSRLPIERFVPGATANEILRSLDAVQYEWEPHLETLDEKLRLEQDKRLARFLLGQLVFAGYAQQTGCWRRLARR
jgi:hypothetical protein